MWDDKKLDQVFLYDTTLRDGAQRRGMSLTLEDKLKIAVELDRFGMAYIEGGWPGSNPKDQAFFDRARAMNFHHAKLVAFGSTRRRGLKPEEDANLQALLGAETPAVAVVGKCWTLHVEKVLGTTLDQNLAMISDSVRFLKDHGREVIYDGEHFFDGYKANPEYAIATLKAAEEAGADWLVLCDTNGGSLPSQVAEITAIVRAVTSCKLGVHTHNDAELAVANALSAVESGCDMVQGTVNGYGERCGNANLISLIPTLQLKMGRACVPKEHLSQLRDLALFVSETANLNPDSHAPYVGRNAFAHKGGIHVAAVEKLAESYEHIVPEVVGNQRRFVVSELSGRGNIRMRAGELGLETRGREVQVLEKVKELERRGFQFESAEGGFELIVRRTDDQYCAPFKVLDTFVISTQRKGVTSSEATVKLKIGNETAHTAAEGDGPVHALDLALRKALLPYYPQFKNVRLVDYKVRILDREMATSATTRVLIEAAHGETRWSTVGCSVNIIEASTQALADSLELFLLRENAVPNKHALNLY